MGQDVSGQPVPAAETIPAHAASQVGLRTVEMRLQTFSPEEHSVAVRTRKLLPLPFSVSFETVLLEGETGPETFPALAAL